MNDIQFINPNHLKPYENNPRQNGDAVDKVAASIKEFGFQQPIVVDKDMVVIVGHTRLKAAKKLKLKKVPVVVADDLTDEQVNAYRLADNKTNEIAEWDLDRLAEELDKILEIDMSDFGFDLDIDEDDEEELEIVDDRDPSMQHNVFENQDLMQFPCNNWYGIPDMIPTDVVGDKMLRFMDWKEVDDPENYIAHFYYDDYKFISAWREPEKYIERLRQFKAVVSPDFSLYTDFPRALQILSCYRRQWCGAYWQYMGLEVIPDVVWGDKASFRFCFEGIPKHSTAAVSSVGVKNDAEWNNKQSDMFLAGYNEMLKRLEPTTILFYGDMIDGCEGNIIQIPSYASYSNGAGLTAEEAELIKKKKK
jgi:hypothetical protein